MRGTDLPTASVVRRKRRPPPWTSLGGASHTEFLILPFLPAPTVPSSLSRNGRLSGMAANGSHFAGEILTTYWYSPAARAIVKSVSRNPYLGTSTVELVDVAHGKHRQVPTKSGSKGPFI